MESNEKEKSVKRKKTPKLNKEWLAMGFVVFLIVAYLAVQLYGLFNVRLKRKPPLCPPCMKRCRQRLLP